VGGHVARVSTWRFADSNLGHVVAVGEARHGRGGVRAGHSATGNAQSLDCKISRGVVSHRCVAFRCFDGGVAPANRLERIVGNLETHFLTGRDGDRFGDTAGESFDSAMGRRA